jgi:hypothetical protein
MLPTKIPSAPLVVITWLQHTWCTRFRRDTFGHGTTISTTIRRIEEKGWNLQCVCMLVHPGFQMHMLCNAFPWPWIIKLRVQPMHDMMMLKACHRINSSYSCFMCSYCCEQDQDEDVQDFKVEHDWDKDVASKVSLGRKGHKYYHQKSTGKGSQPTIDGKTKR